jgi:hypothetical protein
MAQIRQFLRDGAGSATTHQPCALDGGQGADLEKIVENNGLQKFRFEEIAAWGYPDGVFASDYDIVSDTSKARRFGFHDLVDTEEMFLRMFSDFRRERIIP